MGCVSSNIGYGKNHEEEKPSSNITASSFTKPYDGDGGKGIILAILSPEGKDLSKNDEWLPAYIQGTLTTIFNRFSNMTILDRQNLEKIIDEQMLAASGYFSDEDFISLGNLTNAQFVLIGNILNISNSAYSVQFSISDPESGIRMASFIKTCTAGELENAMILKDASYDLLAQMGVQLTEAGRQKLYEIDDSVVNAETSLARGIVAETNGTIIEALSYYYDAQTFNPSLPEAANRINNLATDISSGNIGVSVRNDIERRNAWKNLLDECTSFYNEHPPFEIIYDPVLSQGEINYQNETVDLSFMLKIVPSAGFKVIEDVFEGLNRTKKKDDWGFAVWPFGEVGLFNNYIIPDDYKGVGYGRADREYTYTYYKPIIVDIVLVNESGDMIGKEKIQTNIEVGKSTALRKIESLSTFSERKGEVFFSHPVINPKAYIAEIYFKNVNANDISDNLTLKIASVDGIDTETEGNGGNIKISTGPVKKPFFGSYHVFNRDLNIMTF
jgi:hypothetical protein